VKENEALGRGKRIKQRSSRFSIISDEDEYETAALESDSDEFGQESSESDSSDDRPPSRRRKLASSAAQPPEREWTSVVRDSSRTPFTPADSFVSSSSGLSSASSKLDIFRSYFSDETLQAICTTTILKNQALLKPALTLTPTILLSWFGAAILMGIYHFPELADYFRQDLSFLPITQFWTRDYFLAIYESLKVPELHNEDTNERNAKIQWFVDHFNSVSRSIANPVEFISVDDYLLHNKSRSIMRQYDMKKTARLGFVFYKLASSGVGFVHRLELFAGKGQAVLEEGLGMFFFR